MVPRTPFPSFALALASRLDVNDTENTAAGLQGRRDACSVEPTIDLMKTIDPRLPYTCKMSVIADEDKSETETVFEERGDPTARGSMKGARRLGPSRCLRNLSTIVRMLTCFTGDDPNERG
ncbi:hypothetical protein B0H34DRAFT_291828 [Crassisporium funariophilum]|nr:hypothetical protein B0H34DRAFT_291828 [Crassisporium funariophilum]